MIWNISMNAFAFIVHSKWLNYSGYVSLCCFLETTIYIQSSNIMLV